jgi:hypothetical protein
MKMPNTIVVSAGVTVWTPLIYKARQWSFCNDIKTSNCDFLSPPCVLEQLLHCTAANIQAIAELFYTLSAESWTQ